MSARAERLVAGGPLTIIDYTLPSTAHRLWVIDVPARRVVFNEPSPTGWQWR
jgi:hypothetical protein